MIVINGEIVAQGSQFSLNDVEVVTATVDIEEAAPTGATQAVDCKRASNRPMSALILISDFLVGMKMPSLASRLLCPLSRGTMLPRRRLLWGLPAGYGITFGDVELPVSSFL